MLAIPMYITTKPGIYIFHQGNKVLYVGKAVNLKKRLASYFRKNINGKIRQLLQEAKSLDWIETASEIEAFLQEAELIKKYRPKYNIVLRDDKNYFYAGITKEKFPRIFITHQITKMQSVKRKTQSDNTGPKIDYVGPFTSGTALKIVLKLLRRIFPYCTCKKSHRRPCLSSQIGRCFGYCCIENVKLKTQSAKQTEYVGNIKSAVAVLSGRKKKLIFQLKKEMKAVAKNQEFEKAAKLRDQISGLENIFSHRPFLAGDLKRSHRDHWSKIKKDLKIILDTENDILRIEGYDISNISGQEATGSMVVFIDGKSIKSEYRKFRIKTIKQISDVDMLKEVIGRRLRHQEWPYPDLLLVDGGKAQLNAVLKELRIMNDKLQIRVVALAKREEELYMENKRLPIKLSSLSQNTAFFFQRVRNEAHLFARRYHHKLREIYFSGRMPRRSLVKTQEPPAKRRK